MKIRDNARWVNEIVLAVFILLNLFSLFSKQLLSGLGDSKYYILSIISAAVFLLPVIFLSVRSGRKGRLFLRLKRFKFRWVPVTVCASLVASLAGILLNSLLIKAFGLASQMPANPLGTVTWEEPFAAVLAVIIVPAVFEELFFRGAFLSSFGDDNRTAALIACSLCFAFLHSSPYNFFGPFVAGIIYGLLTYIFDSIYPAILAHLLNNILSVAAWFYSKNLQASGLEAAAFVTAIVMFFVFLYLTLKLLEPFLHKIKGRPKLPLSERYHKNKNAAAIFTPAFFILLALWTAKMIAQLTGFWQ